jgi:hypothetical protein
VPRQSFLTWANRSCRRDGEPAGLAVAGLRFAGTGDKPCVVAGLSGNREGTRLNAHQTPPDPPQAPPEPVQPPRPEILPPDIDDFPLPGQNPVPVREPPVMPTPVMH